MRSLLPGERTDLAALDRQLPHELRVRVRGTEVTGHVPPNCRIWLIALDTADAPGRLLATGPAPAQGEDRTFGAESGVPGLILRLSGWSAPQDLQDSTRLVLGVTWQDRPGTAAPPPFLVEFRTAQRVTATAVPPPAPATRAGGLLLAELYRRGGQWRLWVRSEWLAADGLRQLEKLGRLPPDTLADQAPAAGQPTPPTPAVRPAHPAPPVLPIPQAPIPQAPAPQPGGLPAAAPPASVPTPPAPPARTVAAAPPPAPTLGQRLSGLWDRLTGTPDQSGRPAAAAQAGAPPPPASAGQPEASTESRLPPRTAQAFARTAARLGHLRQLLTEQQSGGLGGDSLRWLARLDTLEATFGTLQAEALELERWRAQARALGVDLPPAARQLEGELERTYRHLNAALAELANTALQATASGSRERLERESLFLAALQEDADAEGDLRL